ncbi:ImmA/IrrE family metallo-endopeptidase [Loktanella salsilacus]|uniref:ImmA/IrrE family metallo-endopeptidase n=1 Tax=Loktanella salsilacus TaxID=195913 RepID=UPI00370433AE
MTEHHQIGSDWFSKPGDSLRNLMQRKGISADEVGSHLGGVSVLRGILDGSRAIDEDIAAKLVAAAGGTIGFWLERQRRYDVALDKAVNTAIQNESDDWLNWVPVPGKKFRGKLTADRVRSELRNRMSFFNVPSIEVWQNRYGKHRESTLFRTSGSFTSEDASVLLWLRRGELEADLVTTQPWNVQMLRDRIFEIRKLSRIRRPSQFLPKLKSLCAEAGVAVVVVKTPAGCHASGASRLVGPNKAMLLLSFRHRTDDQFWFTVFHEIGHLVMHGAKAFVDVETAFEDHYEREANEFAAACIVPENRIPELMSLNADRNEVLRFSVSLGVAPGLVVGQMQHRGHITHREMNFLKRRWSWGDIDPALV